tara:strand:+ start:1520 stop:1870 length:351 start_codon:yes stop_codon:yes gene_type:complete
MTDTKKARLSREAHVKLLNKQSLKQLGLTPDEIIRLVDVLEKVRKLLESEKLYVQRFAGLKRNTKKEDPLECHYIQRCMVEWLKEPDQLTDLWSKVKDLQEFSALAQSRILDQRQQ